MPLKRTVARWLPLLLAVPLGLAACAGDDKERSPMADQEFITIASGDSAHDLPKDQVAAVGEALRQAVEDPQRVADARAPDVFAQALPRSVEDATYDEGTGEVRAGEWILNVDSDGLYWENRIVPPDPPQIGLMFVGRLEQAEEEWTVPRLVFKRLR